MALIDVSAEDRAVIRQVMLALVRGPFLGDDDFERRIGVRRAQVDAVLRWWPDVDDHADDGSVCIAINNSLYEACSRLRVKPREWGIWFPVSPEQVREVYVRWARARGWSVIGPRGTAGARARGESPGRSPDHPDA